MVKRDAHITDPLHAFPCADSLTLAIGCHFAVVFATLTREAGLEAVNFVGSAKTPRTAIAIRRALRGLADAVARRLGIAANAYRLRPTIGIGDAPGSAGQLGRRRASELRIAVAVLKLPANRRVNTAIDGAVGARQLLWI